MSLEGDNTVATIQNAAFSYENHTVFSDIKLTLYKGELFFLMGRNGCGKSTLIDSILGINKINQGKILVNGKSVYKYTSAEMAKEMAYVPQVHNRSFPYKVRQIVLMGRTAYIGGFGSPCEEDQKIVENIMKEVGISHLADRPYTQISGGEMQMVILARALVQQTPIILMDEPTAHLDFYNELLFLEMAAKFVSFRERTVLMAAHSPNQAFYLASHGLNVRVGLMSNGTMYQVGSPDEVLTEKNIAEVYGIKSRIVDDGQYKQIIPIHTNKKW